MSDISTLHREIASRVGISVDDSAQGVQDSFLACRANVTAFATQHRMRVLFTATQPVGYEVTNSQQLYDRLLKVFAPQPPPASPDVPTDQPVIPVPIARSPLQMRVQQILLTDDTPILVIRPIVREGVQVALLTRNALPDPVVTQAQTPPEVVDSSDVVLADLWLNLPIGESEEAPVVVSEPAAGSAPEAAPAFDLIAWMGGRSMRDILTDPAFENLSSDQQTAVYHAFQPKK